MKKETVFGSLHDDRGNCHIVRTTRLRKGPGKLLTVNVLLDRLVRQDGTTIDVDLVTDGDVVTQNSYIFQSCPSANTAVPANDRRLDPGVVLDLAILEDDAALETDTIAYDDIRANGDVGPYAATLSNLCRGINHNVAAVNERLRSRSEQF